MKNIRKLYIAIIFAASLIACDHFDDKSTRSSSLDGSRLDMIKENGVLRVGTTGDYLPFSYLKGEKLSGVDIELAEELAKSLNVKVNFINTTWPTLMDDLLANKFDIGMSGITITDDRQAMAMFSLPMHEGGKAAISRDGETELFDTLAEINQPQVRVIFNPGGTNELFARESFPNAILIENEENITVFRKIVSGEADVMVTDAIETIVQERIHPELDAVNPRAPFSRSQKAYLIQKDEKFKSYLDQWIDELRSTQKLSNIINSQLEKSAQSVSEQ